MWHRSEAMRRMPSLPAPALAMSSERSGDECHVPVLDGMSLPEGAYTNSSIIPNDPVILQADQIHSEMTQWIEAWNDAVGT